MDVLSIQDLLEELLSQRDSTGIGPPDIEGQSHKGIPVQSPSEDSLKHYGTVVSQDASHQDVVVTIHPT